LQQIESACRIVGAFEERKRIGGRLMVVVKGCAGGGDRYTVVIVHRSDIGTIGSDLGIDGVMLRSTVENTVLAS
jgi:hypothetical protein